MVRIPNPAPLPRGRVSSWSKEELDTLSSADLKQLCVNAGLRNETEVAALCQQILSGRKRVRAASPKKKTEGLQKKT